MVLNKDRVLIWKPLFDQLNCSTNLKVQLFLMLFILVFILPLAITSIQVWNESIQINYALWIVKAGAGGNG